MRRDALGIAAALAWAPASAGAQTVRGTVTAGGVGVPGAVVLLVDSAGRTAARAAARDGGAFAVQAPHAGAYTLRVLRIGFAPTAVGPLAVAGTVRRDVALTSAPVRLTEVRVRDRARCEVRPDADAAALLAEAQKALLAESITRAEPLMMRVATAERTLDAAGARVVSERTDARLVPSVRPFASLPPDSLARVGYVARDDAGEATYWAPDADVLLSESFAAAHCFRAEAPAPGDARRARWVGVAFEPARRRDGVAEVAGVLWLDRATAELREFGYRYVNLADDAPFADRAAAGGRVEFLRLPDGGWIVQRWTIRVPLVTARSAARPTTAIVPGVRREAPPARELAGVRVAEGAVDEVRRGDAVVWERGRVGLRVRVVDADQAPVPNAIVELDSGGAEATTGADGVALLPLVLPGPHTLRAHTVSLDLLGATTPARPVRADEESAEPVELVLPSERVALATACGARAAEWREALLRGTVAGAAPNTRVEATWQLSYVRLGGGAPVVATERREVAVDSTGRWALCGVPRDADVMVRARLGAASGPTAAVRVPAAAVGHAVSLGAP